MAHRADRMDRPGGAGPGWLDVAPAFVVWTGDIDHLLVHPGNTKKRKWLTLFKRCAFTVTPYYHERLGLTHQRLVVLVRLTSQGETSALGDRLIHATTISMHEVLDYSHRRSKSTPVP
jgi:hypothetical protein